MIMAEGMYGHDSNGHGVICTATAQALAFHDDITKAGEICTRHVKNETNKGDYAAELCTVLARLVDVLGGAMMMSFRFSARCASRTTG